jgi:DNA-binding transcriptional LysR family regulator
MELRQLATFVAVAEEGSFTRAADRLHVVQSAVSAGVRNLEKVLETRLFDRSTHAVALTDAGRALLPEARATLAAAQAARDAVDEVRGGLRGTVVLGTMQAQGMRAIDLAGLLAAFRAEHPAVTVTIHSGGSSEMARDVLEGRLDLAFVALPGDGPPGLKLIPLAHEPIMLAVPVGHPVADNADVELQALRDEILVDLPSGWGIRMAVDRSFAAVGVARTIT